MVLTKENDIPIKMVWDLSRNSYHLEIVIRGLEFHLAGTKADVVAFYTSIL